MGIDDDASWDQLRAKNLIKFATKNLTHTKFHDGPQRQSSIVITEKSQVQALINMLMKMQDTIDLPPTIISHMPFANATVRHLSVKTTSGLLGHFISVLSIFYRYLKSDLRCNTINWAHTAA